MASIHIISKRLQALSSKKLLHETCKTQKINNVYDMQLYLEKCKEYND